MAGLEVYANPCYKSLIRCEKAGSISHNHSYTKILCRSPLEMSPASPIEMTRLSHRFWRLQVTADERDHDEPQKSLAGYGAS